MCENKISCEWYELKNEGEVTGYIQIKSIWRAPKDPLINLNEEMIVTEKPQLKYSNGVVCERKSVMSLLKSIQTLDDYAMPV